MADMTEEEIARQKAAIDAMGNAKKHMAVALDRIAFLEVALGNAADALTETKKYIGASAYLYSSSPQVSVHNWISDQAAEARRKLG